MTLDVSRALRVPGEEFAFIHREHIQPQDICGDPVAFDGPVTLEGHFSMSGQNLILQGHLQAVAVSRCANCLAPANAVIDVPFREVFKRQETTDEEPQDDPDSLTFSGYRVELAQLAFTLTMLELPIRFLCRPDCTGFPGMMPDTDNEATAIQTDTGDQDNPDANSFAVLHKLLKNDQEA